MYNHQFGKNQAVSSNNKFDKSKEYVTAEYNHRFINIFLITR